jgi:uncharacterized protein (TIGR02302 family)
VTERDRMQDASSEAAGDAAAALSRALGRARWALMWERLWPPLAAIATVLGFFLAASWLGLWLFLPPLGRVVGLIVFGLLLLAAAFPLIFVRLPSRAEALRRLDATTGLSHRPATAIADEIAVTRSDPVSLALWRAHIEKAMGAARALRAGMPSPRLPLRDPFALRALALILVVATFIAAGSERGRRFAAAFDWQGAVAAADYRVDAWVTPPPYTGRPPVILPGLRSGEAQHAAAPVSVPVGSVLVIRSSGAANLDVSVKGGLKEDKPATPSAQPTPSGTLERRYIVEHDGVANLHGAASAAWSFVAVPDRAPTIALTKEPEVQARGGLMLQYKVEDDYGVTEAHAVFARKSDEAGSKAPRPLFGPPDFQLSLPQARTRSGVGQTLRDLAEHPWAGADVVMTLIARDEAGNEGRSEPYELRLPERWFSKPLARALIEQRRLLALDADAKPRVLTALDALAIAPDKFTPDAGVYLGLRSIFWQLTRARSDEALREVVTRLWSMAVMIEDGIVSDAEAALRAAQEALRQALDRGASDEEIKRLTDELRAALDRFMQALAEEMRKNPDRLARAMPNARNIRPQDLKSMIDRMEQLARSGAKDAARRMLEELQSILNNLQMAQPGMSPEGDDEMMSALNELSDMIRKQQQLRDKTFRQGQDQHRDRQRAQRGERGQGDQNFSELRQDQQALRDRLKRMLEELRKRAEGQGQDADSDQQGGPGQGELDQLGRAGDAMGDAEGQLGEGNADGAVDSQGRALDALRKGAQGLAQSMQQQMGQGPGPGQPGRNAPSRAQNDTDPLGRPLRGRDLADDHSVKVPGLIDPERARRILEELRRRLSDPARPQIELDYIERLLKDF